MKVIIPVFVLILISHGIYSQEHVMSGDSIVFVEKTIKKFSKNASFTIVPGPVYNTTHKLGFMILPVVVYKLDTSDKLSPPSSSALMIYFDFNGSWMTAFRQNFYWNQDKWRGSVFGGYGKLKTKYYGIARDSTVINNDKDNYIWNELEGYFGVVNCYRNIFSHLFAGLEYNYTNTILEGADSAGTEILKKSGIETGHNIESILVPAFIWDNRDNIFWTVKGYYAGISTQFANSAFFSSYDYNVLSGFVNGYHSLLRKSNKLTLGWTVFCQTGWGNIPYTRMAIYGRGDNVTGYTRGKYVNNSEVTAQAEIRYDLWNFFAIGGYAGTGKTFKTLETFGQPVWLHFGGARFYLNVMPSKNLRLRLDFAVARKDYGVYLGIGQGF